MGRRGPAPAPTNLRILRGVANSRINHNEPKAPVGVPDCPAWLDDDAKKVWAYTIEQLTAMNLVTLADRDQLAAYCVFTVQFERATMLINRAGLLIKGRKDAAIKNPASQIQRESASMMTKLAADFGLTPRARHEIVMKPDVSEDELQALLS